MSSYKQTPLDAVDYLHEIVTCQELDQLINQCMRGGI